MSQLDYEAVEVNAPCRAGTQRQHHCGQSKGGLVAIGMGPCRRLGSLWLHALATAGRYLKTVKTVLVQSLVQHCDKHIDGTHKYGLCSAHHS